MTAATTRLIEKGGVKLDATDWNDDVLDDYFERGWRLVEESPAAKRRKCLVCGRIIPVRKDGGLRRHSPVWKNPPPGAPVCGGSGV